MKYNRRGLTKQLTNNVLLLTNNILKLPTGGREQLRKLNHDMLEDIFGDQLIELELTRSQIVKLKSIFNAFRGHVDGLSADSLAVAIQEVKEKNIKSVFVDGSNFGEFVRVIKRKFPNIRVYTFFHNVEAKFFLDSLRQTKTPHALAVLMVNYLAERKAVRYSDDIICLNERDSDLLKRVYGRAANHISSMAMQDKLPTDVDQTLGHDKEKFALFVGGAFYANRFGMEWFVKHVAPHLQIKTYIVGRGFEKFRGELEIEGKVEVVGEVDSLAPWYRDAYFVIAPIFDGSGMKTKVAEALMFGKKIIGTPEAFTGYEEFTDIVGCLCHSAEQFVDAIESVDKIVNSSFDPVLREIYEENYSYAAAKKRLEIIMGQ